MRNARPKTADHQSGTLSVSPSGFEPTPAGRISVPEIARRLCIGRLAVYAMLERGIIPGIRLGRRWIITRHAYEHWERICGTDAGGGLPQTPEVRVLN